MLETYRTAVFGFEALRPEEQVTQMGQVGKTCMQELLVYMDARRPVFRLILQGAGNGADLCWPCTRACRLSRFCI